MGREENRLVAWVSKGAGTALVAAALGCWAIAAAAQSYDPLPSWNDGAAKQAILEFVEAVTTEGGADYVAPADRIATFDMDGTLWVEHPFPAQAEFVLDRVLALAPEHLEVKDQDPSRRGDARVLRGLFKSVLAGDREAMAKFTEGDWARIIAATHTGLTTDEYLQIVEEWLAETGHPDFERPYTELIYQPMLEVMEYLRESGFQTYIVTGSEQDFVRAFSEEVYDVPVEQVVGSPIVTQYEEQDGEPVLIREPRIFLIDDHDGKPVGINLFIGKRPYAAFGNSDGDREMLVWTDAGDRARLMVLVLHDDAEREYAYGPANGLVDTRGRHLLARTHGRGQGEGLGGDQHEERLEHDLSVNECHSTKSVTRTRLPTISARKIRWKAPASSPLSTSRT